MRRLLTCLAAVALAGCPTYDRYDKLADQKGMMAADQFASYGPEQAQKIAIGRALGQAYDGSKPGEFAVQMGTAVAFAKTMPDVVDIKADTLAYFLTVRFKSGWRTAVLPIADGKAPQDTPGLPKAAS
jgi:hypothetical protein